MESEKLYEITAYTENQVGLLSSVAGIFTRRSINIEKLLVYPSKIEGIHKFKILARTTEKNARAVVLQMEKRVDVVKAFYQEDSERSFMEIVSVGRFLKERENKQ
ncbi:MAG: ACT domain-containing protein [Bacteroidales bacterium]|jgi:acetolactate synthase-1/3 small subunit|nr:ACT domain-containing protein [Bacteroidales bacterium]MBQ6291975.1 ACT domain-containing protein [Bacteroidales bacterium]MBR4479989.1 ACT domain-containing protein [Bacteroidales bacterium]